MRNFRGIWPRTLTFAAAAALVVSATGWWGCGGGGVFNPAFINSTVGGVFPITPGPGADFVFVRGLNETGQTVEFIITIEREVLVLDDDGNPQQDDAGNFVTRAERQTVNLVTGATGDATSAGVLFECAESPVTLVGLGENLLPGEAAIFVGGEGAGGATGFGVAIDDLNPLSLEAGNFACGDSIIFRAFQSVGVPGGVDIQTFLLAGSQQPSEFTGPDTFVNFQQFLEAQAPEEEP
jgi:hypothetical protein